MWTVALILGGLGEEGRQGRGVRLAEFFERDRELSLDRQRRPRRAHRTERHDRYLVLGGQLGQRHLLALADRHEHPPGRLAEQVDERAVVVRQLYLGAEAAPQAGLDQRLSQAT